MGGCCEGRLDLEIQVCPISRVYQLHKLYTQLVYTNSIMETEKFVLKEGEVPLKQIRDALDLSQEAFGREIGVSVQTVSRWETGRSEPTFTVSQMKKFLRLINRLGWSADDLPDALGSKLTRLN